jgi:sugar phosphate permease
MSKTFRYTMFGLLYFMQSAFPSYFTGFNGIYLISFGVDMKGVGLIGLMVDSLGYHWTFLILSLLNLLAVLLIPLVFSKESTEMLQVIDVG